MTYLQECYRYKLTYTCTCGKGYNVCMYEIYSKLCAEHAYMYQCNF